MNKNNMSDRYQLSSNNSSTYSYTPETSTTRSRQSGSRALLWTLTVILAIANGASTVSGMSILVSASLGVLTVICIVFLVRSYLRKNH